MNLLANDCGTDTPLETLQITKHQTLGYNIVSRLSPPSPPQPIWIYNLDLEVKALSVLYADPATQQQLCGGGANTPLASVRLHDSSSAIDITFRGVPLTMKKSSLSSAHNFIHAGKEYRWSTPSLAVSSSAIFLKRDGQTVGRYEKKPGGLFKTGAQHPTLELYIPVAEIDMDMFCVTGLAVAAYYAKEKKDTIDIATELAGAI